MPENEWRIVDVEALPWPHLLFNCEYRKRAEQLTERLGYTAMQEATRSMVLGLAPAQVAACEYHWPDWRVAAMAAVALVERTGTLAFEDMDQAAEQMDDNTQWAFYSLRFEPIAWGGGERLHNGQHRVCAMKLAGVQRCPVVRF